MDIKNIENLLATNPTDVLLIAVYDKEFTAEQKDILKSSLKDFTKPTALIAKGKFLNSLPFINTVCAEVSHFLIKKQQENKL